MARNSLLILYFILGMLYFHNFGFGRVQNICKAGCYVFNKYTENSLACTPVTEPRLSRIRNRTCIPHGSSPWWGGENIVTN